MPMAVLCVHTHTRYMRDWGGGLYMLNSPYISNFQFVLTFEIFSKGLYPWPHNHHGCVVDTHTHRPPSFIACQRARSATFDVPSCGIIRSTPRVPDSSTFPLERPLAPPSRSLWSFWREQTQRGGSRFIVEVCYLFWGGGGNKKKFSKYFRNGMQ